MYGTIAGDIAARSAGAGANNKTKGLNFPVGKKKPYTYNTVMNLAVADALLCAGVDASEDDMKGKLVYSMRKWGRKYPNAGYPGDFRKWLFSSDNKPCENTRISPAVWAPPAGWLFLSIERTRQVAGWIAETVCSRPTNIKDAEAVAAVIYLARNGSSKDSIRDYVIKEFGYSLTQGEAGEAGKCCHHEGNRQDTVPKAVSVFLGEENFTDVMGTAVLLDSDGGALAAMAASFGEAYYGISKETVLETEDRLDKKLRGPLRDFDRARREVVAVKRDWKIKDMPAEHDHFYLERTFTEEEMANLHRGHVPKEMEDKWFFYMEQDRLYAYRSWTGYLEYMVEFDGVTGRHRVTVNRDAKQYDCTDLEHDREALNYLLDCWAKSPYDYYSEWLNEIYSNMVSNILSAKTEERGKTQC